MMKNSLLMLMLAFVSSAFAQEWSSDVYKHGTKYPGYIILADGSKKEGFIEYTNRYDLQNKVEFYTDKDNRKTREKYKADDLKEYKMADKLYHVIHYSGGLLKKPLRGNLLVEEGCISKYMWYNQADNYLSMRRASGESMDEYEARLYEPLEVYLKKGEEYPVTLDYFALGYKKKMGEVVADQPELAQKVADGTKGYGMLNMLNVIDEYNANCTK